ncbi:unnamed protein product [Adineta steineri]|uniref:AAA+ ATPase domain-containing protein n=1 Tax=Adineta steineri TaxID=433720 RepID=A0A815JS06_9BILA|nr:unnamed protein product [Adineta steineri]CAF1422181.1 unnamed protein product [Adineta steineri]
MNQNVTTAIERVFNGLSKEKLQKLSVSSSSCLSCRVGIMQHMNHKDLLKVENLVFNQVRGFKTKHSSSSHSEDTFNLNDQQKIRIAFAKGYAAATNQSTTEKRPSLFKSIRVILFYSILIILILSIISTLTGDGDGITTAFPFASKYEVSSEDVKVNFSDVRGTEEAKEELMNIVAYLNEPDKYTKLGARLPKGVLLVGSPGIGKTLLARAVAGEAGVPFFHTSGSEFDDMFAGAGARHVRQLFTTAKSHAPCVVFIDEIDSVGAKRSNLKKNEGIIVLAATNRRDYLDSALLRPGRFDSEIYIAPPDLRGRKEIFELYLSKMKHDPSIDTEYLARGTTGFTGAEIENMVNQAALYAAQLNCLFVSMKHLEWARDKVLMGPAKKSKLPDFDTNNITAYHEAGHTIVRYYTRDADPLHKVTIIPRGQALGFTAHIPIKETYNRTRSQLLAEMDVMMGGRVAEEQIFGTDKITTGASNDFSQATKLAANMVKQFGMSDKIGTRSFQEEEQDAGLGFVRVNNISPTMQEMIDLEIKQLMEESYDRAKILLKKHARELKILAEALLHFETLSADEVKSLIEGRRIH